MNNTNLRINNVTILEGTRLKMDNEADFPGDDSSEFHSSATKLIAVQCRISDTFVGWPSHIFDTPGFILSVISEKNFKVLTTFCLLVQYVYLHGKICTCPFPL